MNRKQRQKSGTFLGDSVVITGTLLWLKLTDHTDLGWWSVFAPVLFALILLGLAGMLLGVLDVVRDRQRRKAAKERIKRRQEASKARRLRDALSYPPPSSSSMTEEPSMYSRRPMRRDRY